MTRLEIIAWLGGRGWRPHPRSPKLYVHPNNPGRRFRVSKQGLKVEGRTTGGDWVRMRSAYYRDCKLLPDGRLTGLTAKGMGA